MNKSKSPLNILLILLIGGIGVQTFTSCFSDDEDDDDTGGTSSSSKPFSSSAGTSKSSSSGIDNSKYGDPVTYDGKTYQTVIIGEQTWFKQNLGSYTYATAMDLPSECPKDSNPSCKITLPHRGVCPEGFHIPSQAEWGKLYQYVMANMVGEYKDPCEHLGKKVGFQDTYGFSADGNMNWWIADEQRALTLEMSSILGTFISTLTERSKSNSVRCLKDGAIYKIPEQKQLTDTRDNQTYKTIMIGRQNWMAENLKFNATGSKCGDDDKKLKDTNTTTCDNYGRLYNWATAMNLPSKCNETLSTSDADCNKNAVHQGVCPSGWHLPSRDEWHELERYAYFGGGSLRSANGWGTEEGRGGLFGEIKIIYDLNGTNDYGFSALPGGGGYVDTYEDEKFSGYWSASEETNEKALGSSLRPARSVVGGDWTSDARDIYGIIGKDDKPYYFSVRCLQD